MIMYNYIDGNSATIAVIYFVFMVFFGSFFTLQLVLALIVETFAQENIAKKKG